MKNKNYIEPQYLTKTDLYYLQEIENIDTVWEKIELERRKTGIELRLSDINNNKMFFVITQDIKNKIQSLNTYNIEKYLNQLTSEYKDEILFNKKQKKLLSDIEQKNYSAKKYSKIAAELKCTPSSIEKTMFSNSIKVRDFILNNTDCYFDSSILMQLYSYLTEGLNCNKNFRTGNIKKYTSTHKDYIVDHNDIENMLSSLNDFINITDDYRFHPILKVIISNYYIRYVSPVEFANDYLAYCVSYFILAKYNIAGITNFPVLYFNYNYRSKLDNAYITSLNHGSDLTYVITEYLDALGKENSKNYNILKNDYLVNCFMKKLVEKKTHINDRQEQIIKEMIYYNKDFIEIEYYKQNFSVVQETARKDLETLAKIGIVKVERVGKKFIYKLNLSMI